MKKHIVTSILVLMLGVTSVVFSQNISSTQKLIGTSHYYYEPSTKSLEMDSTAFSYDKQGNKVEILWFNGNKNIQATAKSTCTYTESNLIKTQENYLWDVTQNCWSTIPISKTTYSYNNSDSLISMLSEKFNSLIWVKNSKTDFLRDQNNNCIEEVTYSWDSLSKNWNMLHAQKSTYNFEQNKCTIITHYRWEEYLQNFKPLAQTVFTYNTNGQIETKITKTWTEANTWTETSKDSIVYDDQNMKIEEYGYDFNNDLKIWNPVFKLTYSNNTNNQLLQTKFTSWDSSNNSFKLANDTKITSYTYNQDNNITRSVEQQMDIISKQLITTNEDKFYYEIPQKRFANIPNLALNTFTISPNPFMDKVQISSTIDLNQEIKITVLNNLGNKQNLELEFKNNEIIIYTNSLAKGIYYIHIETKETSYLNKIIKI